MNEKRKRLLIELEDILNATTASISARFQEQRTLGSFYGQPDDKIDNPVQGLRPPTLPVQARTAALLEG